MSDEEKHLATNGVYKPEIAAAIANLKVIAKWGGAARISAAQFGAFRRNSPTARPPPLQMPRVRGVCQHTKRPVRC